MLLVVAAIAAIVLLLSLNLGLVEVLKYFGILQIDTNSWGDLLQIGTRLIVGYVMVWMYTGWVLESNFKVRLYVSFTLISIAIVVALEYVGFFQIDSDRQYAVIIFTGTVMWVIAHAIRRMVDSVVDGLGRENTHSSTPTFFCLVLFLVTAMSVTFYVLFVGMERAGMLHVEEVFTLYSPAFDVGLEYFFLTTLHSIAYAFLSAPSGSAIALGEGESVVSDEEVESAEMPYDGDLAYFTPAESGSVDGDNEYRKAEMDTKVILPTNMDGTGDSAEGQESAKVDCSLIASLIRAGR